MNDCKNRNTFETPKIEIVVFNQKDIIVTSSGGNSANPGDKDDMD